MRKISDTIARLAALQSRPTADTPVHGAPDRLSVLGGFGSNPGALQARFYLPETLSEGAPLVVVLHGCTQNAAGYDYRSGWSQLAEEAGFALLYPEQQRANNANLCFNWFLPADTTRDRGEALSIRQMIEAMVITYGLDRKRIFITGLSAGGAMAVAMLATYPELFAGGGIIAGLPYGSATTIPEAFDRMRGHGGHSDQDLQRLVQGASTHKGPWPGISIWQGSADHTVAPSNAEAIAAQWRGVHKLSKAPSQAESKPGWTKQIWCDPAGTAKIEVNIVGGMGHGTPLGDDGLGSPGPYMLAVGISSTSELAQFWGILKTRANATTRSMRGAPPPAGDRSAASPLRLANSGNAGAASGRDPVNPPQGLVVGAPNVKKIIEDALRAAGLMR